MSLPKRLGGHTPVSLACHPCLVLEMKQSQAEQLRACVCTKGCTQRECNAATKKAATQQARKCSPYWQFFDLYGPFISWEGVENDPQIGTTITKCVEDLENEKHVLDPGQLFPYNFLCP